MKTNLALIDWAIILLSVVMLRVVSASTRKHMKGVADFLSANRCAGRYLLAIAAQMGSLGAISFVAYFEVYYEAGLTFAWWALLYIPLGAIIIITGWVFYRFRETRALTMAQFFEMRYSRRFRIFAGFLCWICGILNFGIFPAVTAKFFIYFCGLPLHFYIPGLDVAIPTFPVVMLVNLGLAIPFITMGGQISIMVTECFQGIISGLAFIVICGVVLMKLHWGQIVDALSTAPVNASMLHPFHTSQIENFNIWYVLIGFFGAIYGYMSWQGTQGFYSSARNPHEQKMGGLIGLWRDVPKALLIVLLPIAAYAVLHLSEYSSIADTVNATLRTIDNEAVRNQMRVPVVLANFLPIGIKGLFATVMLFFSLSCFDTYMHSWGSIFIQDVVMPIRQRPLEPAQHIRWLRWSIVGVAAFSFLFSWVYPQSHQIVMFMAITGTIWAGGSGACIVGGLYWKKGTTAAAYSALILGAVLGVAGLVLPDIYKEYYHSKFPINGQWLWFIAMIAAIVVYFTVSLLTCGKGKEFDLSRMLHRDNRDASAEEGIERARPSKLMMIVGITEEFSLFDRILAIAMVVWNFGWFAFFIGVTVLNLVFNIGNPWWANFWHIYIWLYFGVSIPVTIWFTVGGIIDIRALYRTLATAVRNDDDDGSVAREPAETLAVSDEPGMEKVSEAQRSAGVEQ